MKDIVIIYHGHCFDGFGSAWAVKKKFGDSADYFGISHDNKVLPGEPGELHNKEIYMIDFTFPEEVVRQLLKENKQVTAIDHHVTAEAAVKLTQKYSFDLNHSGAVLAWQYFHKDLPVPTLLKYIEDSDLWRFALPESREINAYLRIFKQDFNKWDELAAALENENSRKEIVQQGAIILQYKQRLVDQLVERADTVEFEGIKTLAVNTPTFFASEVGHALTKKLPPMGIGWSQQQGKKVFSLRSDGSVDVSVLAKKYSGGGHAAASGFVLDASDSLPWKVLKNEKSNS